MTPLAGLIKGRSLAGTPAELVAHMAEPVELDHDHTLWNYAMVADTFGEVAAEGLASAIQGAGLVTAVYKYATDGFDLSLTRVQGHLAAIGTAVPGLAEVCSALQLIGRPVQPRWQREYQLEALPSEEQIAAAQAELVVADWWAHVVYDVVPVMLVNGSTIAQIKTAISESV